MPRMIRSIAVVLTLSVLLGGTLGGAAQARPLAPGPGAHAFTLSGDGLLDLFEGAWDWLVGLWSHGGAEGGQQGAQVKDGGALDPNGGH
jgi:hypothetical protein